MATTDTKQQGVQKKKLPILPKQNFMYEVTNPAQAKFNVHDVLVCVKGPQTC